MIAACIIIIGPLIFMMIFFLNFHVVAVMVLKLLTVHKYTYKAGYLLYSCKISMKYSKTSKLVDLLS